MATKKLQDPKQEHLRQIAMADQHITNWSVNEQATTGDDYAARTARKYWRRKILAEQEKKAEHEAELKKLD